jgi:lipoate---protein ligase
MLYLDLTFSTPEANLACDEALLDQCEADPAEGVLRFWESPTYFVVLGHASRMTLEVSVPECRSRDLPILRRCSGGAAVLQGPGCLNYALILPISDRKEWQTIADTNALIMMQHCQALAAATGHPIHHRGSTDLAIGQEKFSGNAQRRKRRSILFHGTFLLDFEIERLAGILPLPPQQPAYRRARSHRAFLTNLNQPASTVKDALQSCWQAHRPFRALPRRAVDSLASAKYAKKEWIYRC